MKRQKMLVKKLLALGLILCLQLSCLPVSPAVAQATVDESDSRPDKTDFMESIASASAVLPSELFSDWIQSEIMSFSQDSVGLPSARLQSLTHIRNLLKKHFKMGEKVSIVIDHPQDKSDFKTTLINSDGKEVSMKVETIMYGDVMVLSVLPPRQFKPGKYTLRVKDEVTNEDSTQDFTWGVLAINTNKSVYTVGEKAVLSMAVLDHQGKMVCDAALTLTIHNPQSTIHDTLSTENGGIRVNPECQVKDFVEKPDYEAGYEVEGVGTYRMTLTATTGNGEYQIEDAFEVKESVPFSIERKTATRIYPPVAYPVEVAITAYEDFSGTVVETVPESFEVITDEKADAFAFDSITIGSASITPSSGVLGSQTSLLLPYEGGHEVTQLFGEEVTDPLMKEKYKKYGVIGHDGVDFDLPEGTKVVSVDEGEVVMAKENGDYGTTIVIEHTWGKSYYGHLSEMTVEVGKKVKRGAVIALSGSTGLSTAAHLHFGLKLHDNNAKNGYFGKIDPAPILGISEVKDVLGVNDLSEERVKLVSWEVDLKKGEEVVLGYSYKAPLISPQFYTLGPLRLFSNNSVVFSEARSWQIAADDTASYTITDGSSTATLTSGACDTSQTNGTASDGAQGTVIRSQCVGRNDVPVVKWNKTLTWETMGIPAGSTITQVDGSFKYRVVSETHAATQAMGTMQLRNSADSADCAASDLEASFDPGAVNASFTTRNSSGAINVSAGCQASSTSVTIRLNMSPATGNNNSATSELRADDISLSITYTPPTPDLQQIHYRWRNDDGSETTATWRRSEDISSTAIVGETRRIRLEVSNEGTATATSTTYRLEYGLQSTTCDAIVSWTQVPASATSEAFEMVDTANITDGNSTTAQLTAENSTFVAGQIKDTSSQSSGISLTTSQYTELEYAISPVSGNVSTNEVYCFRLTNAGSTTNFTYTVYPELTIGEPNFDLTHYRWRNDDGGERNVVIPSGTATLHPTGQGNYTAWTATGCTENTAEWDCVNDNNANSGTPGADDGGTTSLATTTGSARSSFTLTNDTVPTSSVITQIEIFMIGAEVSGGGADATATAFYRLNSSDTDCSASDTFSGTTYTTQSCVFSSLSLSTTDLSNLEIGILFGSNDPTITKVYVTVTYTYIGATFKQSQDTPHTGQATAENIRLRVQVANTGDVAATRRLRLEYAEQTGGSCGDETFLEVPTSSGSEFQMADSQYFNNGEATTPIFTATGSFVAGQTLDTANSPSVGFSIGATSYTEMEYNFLVNASAGGKVFCFRVSDNGTDLDAYSKYAVLTVGGGGPTLDQLMRHGKWFSSGVEQPFTF